MKFYKCIHDSGIVSCYLSNYSTAQRQLDTCMQAAGSAPEGDISTTCYGHADAC